MLLPGGRCFQVIGHRGAAARAPENTAASLRAGLDAGADAIEFDVGLTADGRVVLLHDLTLDRTTSSSGRLDAWTWERLCALDAGAWFGKAFSGEPLLDLDGALALVRGRVPVLVEIKAAADDGAPRAGSGDVETVGGVVAGLLRTGGFEHAVLSCSHWPLLQETAGVAPELPRALTVHWRERRDPLEWAARTGAQALHANRRLCTRPFVDRAHAAGLEVFAYTVNRSADLVPLLAAGADGVFSDDPASIRRLLARRHPRPRPRSLTLGVDQGSGGTRAVLVDVDGRVLAWRSVAVATRRQRDGSLVQDPEAIAASVVRATVPLLDAADAPVARAGIATQRSSLVVWDRADGRAVAPLLSWRGPAVGYGGALSGFPVHDDVVRARTGLTARFPYRVHRLAALMQVDPAIARGIREGHLVAGSVGDFLAARLAGRRNGATDPSLAQRMLLFDVRRLCWDEELCALVGIPVHALPHVHPSTADRGRLRLGRHRPRLAALAGDTGAAFVAVTGAGVRAEAGDGQATGGVVVLGTGGFVLAGTGRAAVDAPGLLTTLLWQDAAGPHYAVEGTVHGLAAGLVEARRLGGLETLALDLAVSRAGVATRAPRVLPALEGLGTPEWDPTSRFEIEPGDWSPEEIMKGTLEGFAEQFGRIGDLLGAAGIARERWTGTGGLAFPHLTAAIGRRLGVPVSIEARPHRTAAGAAILARAALSQG